MWLKPGLYPCDHNKSVQLPFLSSSRLTVRSRHFCVMRDTEKKVALRTFICKIMKLSVNMFVLPESVLKYKNFS